MFRWPRRTPKTVLWGGRSCDWIVGGFIDQQVQQYGREFVLGYLAELRRIDRVQYRTAFWVILHERCNDEWHRAPVRRYAYTAKALICWLLCRRGNAWSQRHIVVGCWGVGSDYFGETVGSQVLVTQGWKSWRIEVTSL